MEAAEDWRDGASSPGLSVSVRGAQCERSLECVGDDALTAAAMVREDCSSDAAALPSNPACADRAKIRARASARSSEHPARENCIHTGDDGGLRRDEPVASGPSQPAQEQPSREFVLGVCGMAKKTGSRSMRLIVEGMQSIETASLPDSMDSLTVRVFDQELILHAPVEMWPACHALFVIDSEGFPLDKALEYERQAGYRMISMTDLHKQRQMRDRRFVYRVLAEAGVSIPECIFLCRNEQDDPTSELFPECQIPVARSVEEQADGGLVFSPCSVRLQRPFVEKPACADNHAVYIYGDNSSQVRKLFRKTRTQSSCLSSSPDGKLVSIRGVDLDPRPSELHPAAHRAAGYVYEPFLAPRNGQDVKVYAVGRSLMLAALRKSPSMDGIVERNASGRERRTLTPLSAAERRLVSKVVDATGQFVCGLDLLRPAAQRTGSGDEGDGSLVIDVNGVSFVKDNDAFCREAGGVIAQEAVRRWAGG